MSQPVRTARPPAAGPAFDPPGGGNGAARRRHEGGETGRSAPGPRLTCLVALIPGALAVYLGFNAGGFFAGSTAVAAVALAATLVAAATLLRDPLAGLSLRLFIVVGAMAALCAWTLASALWSGSPSRALLEFDRSLLYLLALVAFAALVRTERSMRWLVWGLATSSVVLCGAGLVTRVLPGLWHVALDPVAEGRLSFPVSYWNALGLVAGTGIVLCAAITTGRREPRPARVLAAAAIPLLATALYFTFSRGALLATAVGLITFVLVGRPRALLSGLAAALPATALAVGVGLHADRLSSAHPVGQTASDQGHGVALAVVLSCACAAAARALLLRFDERAHISVSARARRFGMATIAALAVAGVVGLGASRGSAWLDHQRERLLGTGGIHHTDQRKRLVDLGNNGRADAWRVAGDAFRSSPLTGKGAGTFENIWAQRRPAPFNLVDAHSLYVESLAELGLPGFLLIGVVVVGILAALARRCRGPDRVLYAGLFAAALAWALHAGLDWDWEMPVVTLWVFAAGGAALATRRARTGPVRTPGRLPRVVAGLGLLLVAVTPALIAISQSRLDAGVSAFHRHDCDAASDEALRANSVLPARPEPFELLAYCDARAGLEPLAARMMNQAIDRDRDNWELRYGRAIVLGFGGRDPRPALAEARSLNPLEPLLSSARADVRRAAHMAPAARRAGWRRWARSARLPI
jgi:O-antigen ligase